MWQVISRPDVLIFLDASEETVIRRGRRPYMAGWWEEQQVRLAHARAHCDLYIMTDELTPSQVLERVQDFLVSCAKQRNDLTVGLG